MRQKLHLVVLLLIASLLAACGSQPTMQDPTAVPIAPLASIADTPVATPQTIVELAPLRIVNSFEVASLNPAQGSHWFARFGSAETPMRVDEQFVIQPWLITALEPLDPLTWQLRVREGITFQNGRPLTAEAMAGAINWQLENSAGAKASLPGARAEAVDVYELRLITANPEPTMPALLADEGVFPIHDVATVQSVGEDYAALAGKGIYTGPYAIASHSAAEIVLERFDGYWRGKPALPGVIITRVPDVQARILAVQNGEADIALYPPTEVKRTLAGSDNAFFRTPQQGLSDLRLMFNLDTPPFDERAVRLAFIKGIDYIALGNEVMDGVYTPATGFFPPVVPYLVNNLTTDLTGAQRLLDEAGWLPRGDGIREKDGQPLRIVMAIYPQQPDLVPVSIALQAQLRELGFDIQIQSVDDINEAMRNDLIPWNAGLVFLGHSASA